MVARQLSLDVVHMYGASNFFDFKKIMLSSNPLSKLSKVVYIKAGGPCGSAVMFRTYVDEKFYLIPGLALLVMDP